MNVELLRAQSRVERTTARLEKRLGLSGWLRIEHHFITVAEDEESDGTSTASCRPDWEHRMATIKWRLYEVVTIEDEELELIALHEYVHILIDPFAHLIPKKKLHLKLEELAVESVARCLHHALAH